MIESKFRVVCQPGSFHCRRKGPWAETPDGAENQAKKLGWFHEVYRHGHHGESMDRWFCPHHAKRFDRGR